MHFSKTLAYSAIGLLCSSMLTTPLGLAAPRTTPTGAWQALPSELVQHRKDDFRQLIFSNSHVYIVTQNRGIYRYDPFSNSASESLLALNTGLPKNAYSGFSVSALTASKTGTLYAGTQEGVYKNTGEKWQAINTGLSTAGVKDIAVLHGTLYAAFHNVGILKSTDNGKHWQPILTNKDSKNIIGLYRDGNHLFARFPKQVYQIASGDTTWQSVYAGKVGEPKNFLALDGAYYASSYVTWPNRGIARSIDGGKTWVNFNEGLPKIPRTEYPIPHVKAFFTLQSNVYFVDQDGVVYQTNNHSQQWTAINHGFSDDHSIPEKTYATAATHIGNDIYMVATDGKAYWLNLNEKILHPLGMIAKGVPFDFIQHKGSTLFAGNIRNNIGIYQSEDQGIHWQRIDQGLNQDLSVISASDQAVYAGTYSHGIYTLSNDHKWTTLNDQTIENTLVTHRPDITRLAADGDTIFVGTRTAGLYTFNPQLNSWYATEIPSQNFKQMGNVSGLNHIDGSLYLDIYAYGDYVSKDQGVTWQRLGTPSDENGSSNVNFAMLNNTLYMSVDAYNGGIFKLTDPIGGWHRWERVNDGLNNNLFVQSLVTDGGNLYAGLQQSAYRSGGVYISQDHGQHWTSMNTGLNSKNVKTLITLPNHNLMAGTTVNPKQYRDATLYLFHLT